MPEIQTRAFTEDDIPQLLQLMRGLAVFEGYIDEFTVTEEDLARYGLGPEPRFEAFVAQESDQGPLLGTAVVYRIPWTFDLRPTLVLKELFVDPSARSKGVGKALMRHVATRAGKLDCPRVVWTVLKTNQKAADFYGELGAAKDQVWDSWSLTASAIPKLAGS